MSSNLPIDLYNNNLITNGILDNDLISLVQTLDTTRSYAVQFIWAGASSPVGSFALEASNDNSTFTPVTDSFASVTGNDGSIVVNVELPAYRYVRVHYTPTSGGGGVVNCTIHGKA